MTVIILPARSLRWAVYYCACATALVLPRRRLAYGLVCRQPFRLLHHHCRDKKIGRGFTLQTQQGNDDSQKPKMGDIAHSLLTNIIQRADRTLGYAAKVRVDNVDGEDIGPPATNHRTAPAVRDLLGRVQQGVSFHGESADRGVANSKTPRRLLTSSTVNVSNSDKINDDDGDLLNYGSNPTITMTALAHTLWKSVIRPGNDSAIDATAGNGGDATVLAKLLFVDNKSSVASHLVCIDIEQAACEATQAILSKVLSKDIFHDNVSIHLGSHSPLTLPPSGTGPVAVCAYNLGYLPGRERSNDATTITQTSTTLSSLADAALCLRLGGLLSVLTYPMTNAVEDKAVQALVEGMALFSSQSNDWREFLVNPDPIRYPELDDETRREIRQRLQYIHQELGDAKQCWRVHVHEKLGWLNAPRLLTATRVR